MDKLYILILMIINSVVYSDVIRVPDGDDIGLAIDNASDGDTLIIEKTFIMYSSEIVIDKNISIIGEDRDSCAISFGNDGILFSAENLEYVHIENLQFSNLIHTQSFIDFRNVENVSIKNIHFKRARNSVNLINCNFKISDCLFHESFRDELAVNKNSIKLDKVSGIIENSIFDSVMSCVECLELRENDSLVIINNEFRRSDDYISVFSSRGNYVIRGNEFNVSDPTSVIYAKVFELNFASNRIFFRGDKSAITVIGASSSSITNNIFFSEEYSDLAVYPIDVDSLSVVNNTFYNFKTVVSNMGSKLFYINNIAYMDNNTGEVSIQNNGETPAVIRYNDFYQYGKFWEGEIDPRSEGNFEEDPLFVSLYKDDLLNLLCLQCNSPCLDAGDTTFKATNEHDDIIDLGYTGNTSRGCGPASTPVEENETVNGKWKNKLKIFPQPCDEMVNIVLPEFLRNYDVKIFSVTGESVFPGILKSEKSVRVKTKEMNNGIYFVLIKSGDKKYTSKLVVIH